MRYLEKIVDCYPQSEASAIPGSVFDPLLTVYASGKPWSATDNAAEAIDDIYIYFFLTKNTV